MLLSFIYPVFVARLGLRGLSTTASRPLSLVHASRRGIGAERSAESAASTEGTILRVPASGSRTAVLIPTRTIARLPIQPSSRQARDDRHEDVGHRREEDQGEDRRAKEQRP
jgi:hypothetical protein